jgi:hypothetical protein
LWCVARLFLAWVCLTPALSTGQTITPPLCAQPQNRVLLTIRLENQTAQRCDLSALDALPQKTISTRLPRELGLAHQVSQWSGVPLSHIARAMGAGPGSEVQLIALNHYAVSIPLSDLERFDPVLATRRNGEAIAVRDKGPLILIYPFDQHRELNTLEYHNRSIWQVSEIRIR